MYLGLIVASAEKVEHIAAHEVTLDDVRDAVQWPSRPLSVRFEDREPHGPRWIALGVDTRGRRLLVALDPVPEHDGESAETWSVRTAYPLM